MPKSTFMKKYAALSDAEKSSLRRYYEDIYKGAIFTSTLAAAEIILVWMNEADAK